MTNNVEQNTYGYLRQERDDRINTRNTVGSSMSFFKPHELYACEIRTVSVTSGHPIYTISPLVKDNQPSAWIIQNVRGVDDDVLLAAGDKCIFFIDAEGRRYVHAGGGGSSTTTLKKHTHNALIAGSQDMRTHVKDIEIIGNQKVFFDIIEESPKPIDVQALFAFIERFKDLLAAHNIKTTGQDVALTTNSKNFTLSIQTVDICCSNKVLAYVRKLIELHKEFKDIYCTKCEQIRNDI